MILKPFLTHDGARPKTNLLLPNSPSLHTIRYLTGNSIYIVNWSEMFVNQRQEKRLGNVKSPNVVKAFSGEEKVKT